MKRLDEIVVDTFGSSRIRVEKCGIEHILSTDTKARVNIIALGDVGTNVLMGLKLLGGDVIEEIGIYDLNSQQIDRLELEFNQMYYPPVPEAHKDEHVTARCLRDMPRVKKIASDEELLNCDVLVFCATRSVPELGTTGDVRMMQLEANLELVKGIGSKIRESRNRGIKSGFDGLVAVVSDPVDQLCKGMLDSSGLKPGQIRGFGLGVMAARARYYADKLSRDDISEERRIGFAKYLSEGRAFGPHGQDLIIANSIKEYDDDISKELTKLTVEANLKVRELGFKPFLAPAISSAALSIILTIRGEWNYGSVFFGVEGEPSDGEAPNYEGAFLGVLSRLTNSGSGIGCEDLNLPEALYDRILNAYRNLL